MLRKKHHDFDLIVIGSGSGGSVGAHFAASLGKKVAVFEKGDIGGECPNWACVPTKALLHSAHVLDSTQEAHLFGIDVKDIEANYPHVRKWKDLVVERTGTSHGASTFHDDGIELIKHRAEFISPHEVKAGDKTYSASRFLIATGSSVFIPHLPGLEEAGYITFKEAVDLKEAPKSLFIIGGGAVACEFAHIFSTFGSKVTIAARSTLLSNEDKEVIDLVQALFENEGIAVLNQVSVNKVEKKGKKKIVHFTFGGQESSVEVDEILVATGKTPILDIGLDKARVKTSKSGIIVNSTLQTSTSHIYAAGDVVGPYLFTHTAYYQSYIATHNAFSYQKIRVNYKSVPRCVFIKPEVASVGLSETQAKEKGIKIKVGMAAISVVGRANTSNELDGFVKVITDKKGTVIGSSMVAPAAGEMIHILSLAIKLNLKATVLSEMIYAYPTFSESIKVACSNIA